MRVFLLSGRIQISGLLGTVLFLFLGKLWRVLSTVFESSLVTSTSEFHPYATFLDSPVTLSVKSI